MEYIRPTDKSFKLEQFKQMTKDEKIKLCESSVKTIKPKKAKFLDFEAYNLQISSTDSCDFLKLFKDGEKYFSGIPANVIRLLNESELYDNLEKQTETSLE